MAKEEVTPLRSIRLPNERGESGRAVGGARTVITEASEMSKEQLQRLAEKGDVVGMETETAPETEAKAPTKRSAKKGK